MGAVFAPTLESLHAIPALNARPRILSRQHAVRSHVVVREDTNHGGPETGVALLRPVAFLTYRVHTSRQMTKLVSYVAQTTEVGAGRLLERVSKPGGFAKLA